MRIILYATLNKIRRDCSYSMLSRIPELVAEIDNPNPMDHSYGKIEQVIEVGVRFLSTIFSL